MFFDKLPINNKVKEFTYKLNQRGLYEMCFELHDGKTPVRVFFHVNYKPLNADGSDSSRVVNKDEVPTLQQDLQLIERKLKDISIEIEHAKRQESYLNTATGKISTISLLLYLFTQSLTLFLPFFFLFDYVETTQSRLEWFSLMSIVILLGMSVWQIVYLRSFFTAKKLL